MIYNLLKLFAAIFVCGLLFLVPLVYAGFKTSETYREYYSAQISKDGFKYEQKINETLVYTKIMETEQVDVPGSTFWTKKYAYGAPYRFVIGSLNYSGTEEPLIVTGAWLSIDGQAEIALPLDDPLEIDYKDGDPGTGFRTASYSVSLEGILDFEPEREVIARLEYQQPGNDATLTIRTRFLSKISEHSVSELETMLFGG